MEGGYSEVVHWQKNTFTVPFGKAEKEFVFELSKLLRAYADGTIFESIAFLVITTLSLLFLQKPFHHSKQKDHLACWGDACLVGREKILLSCCGRDAQFSLDYPSQSGGIW